MRAIVMKIPRGRVASYGQIADLAGYPRHARFVSRAMSQAPVGVTVPWHRVVSASGGIAFPRDSDGFVEQGQRLALEGVTVIAGKIDMSVFAWRPDLDELMWGPDAIAES